jgi:hypothetical protein
LEVEGGIRGWGGLGNFRGKGHAAVPQDIRDPFGAGQRDHSIRSGETPGVILAETGIDAPKQDRDLGMDFSGQTDRLLNARIPIGHLGGHEDGGRIRDATEFLFVELRREAVAAEGSRNPSERGRRWDPGPPELPGAEGLARGSAEGPVLREERMVHVEAVEQVDANTGLPEMGGDRQQSKGLRPEIVRGEIMDPRVDQDDGGVQGLRLLGQDRIGRGPFGRRPWPSEPPRGEVAP